MRHLTAAALTGLVLSLALATSAAAQQASRARKPAEGPRTIVIRGVLPTPQVVTVRPRDIPDFDRGVFVPSYYDRHFDHALDAPAVVMNGTIGGLRLAPRTAATVARTSPPAPAASRTRPALPRAEGQP